jgi:hypothetical protein
MIWHPRYSYLDFKKSMSDLENYRVMINDE